MAALCEDCDGCCRVFEVKEISKSFGEPCKHLGPTLDGPGCRIYEERPDACKHYVCLWLDGQRRGGQYRLDPELRPDRSKVVLGWPWANDRETLFVYPYPDFPNAWKEGAVRDRINTILLSGGKILVYINSEHIVYAYGTLVMAGTEKEFADILQELRFGKKAP